MEPAQECADIRSKFNKEEDFTVAQYLHRLWPHYSGPAASGIACLTMVLRTIYAHLPRHLWNEFGSSEQLSPLLSHGWLTFGQRPAENHEGVLQNLVMTIWGQSLDDVSKSDKASELTFEALINSDNLTDGLWSREEFRIFQPLLWFQKGTHIEWVDYHPDQAPDSVNARLRDLHPFPPPSAIKVTLTPGDSLSGKMGEMFGPFSTSSGDNDILLRPAAPAFLYLTATIGGEQRGQVKLDMFRSFKLHCGRFEAAGGGEPVWNHNARSVHYTLVAAVRYRSAPHESDHVYLYDSFGQRVQPMGPASTFQNSYASGDVDIDNLEPGSKLFLLFVKANWDTAGTPRDRPEASAPDRTYNSELKILRSALDR